VWLILACASPEPDSRRFAAALGHGPEACAAIGDALLRSHCQAANGASCDAIEPGPWRDECFFVDAEATQDPAACPMAGPYAGECFTHLYKVEVGTDLESAEALEQRFIGLGAESWQAPWGWWWRRHHQAAAIVDRGCSDLSPPQERRCVREAIPALRLAFRGALAERPRELCGIELDDLREGPLPWIADPELDAAVLEELRVCP